MSESAPPPDKDDPKEPDRQDQENEQDQENRKARDLGREFSARAARPGSVQDRLGTEADAYSSFASAEVRAEHAAGRDMTIHYHAVSATEGAIRLARLRQEELDESFALFVPPAGFEVLRRAIAARRVLFVQADADRGKYLAAKNLLSASSAIYRLDPDTRLRTVTADALVKGAGYILADLPGASARELTAYDITGLTTALEECDARLVVTVVSGRRLGDPEVAGLLLELGEVTDRVEVFYRHLERHLDDRGIDAVFADAELMRLVKDELAASTAPRHAASLARFAADALRADEPLCETVRERLVSRGASDFEAWAEGLPDLPTQSMALAVAVLGGEPYETVSAAADLLQRALEPEKPLESAEQARLAPLVARKGPRLRSLRAHVVPSTVQTWHGGAPTQAVRYRDKDYQQKYLLYFWNEYDHARPLLLGWLRACATHSLESVRVRAAVATGVLAARSFDHVRAAVIRPWAESEDPDLHDAAARALHIAATADAGLQAPIRNLVRAWSADESPELKATSARSWRIDYDAAGPAAALKALEDLGACEDLDVTTAICHSVTEMWEVEGEKLEAPRALLDWLRHRTRKHTARLAFLLAAADLVRKMDGVTWPALLHIATGDPVRHREIATLWRDAVTAPRLHPNAKEVLAEWAFTVEHDAVARRAFARLMASLAEHPRSATIITHEAAKWGRGTRRAPATSAETLDLIRRTMS